MTVNVPTANMEQWLSDKLDEMLPGKLQAIEEKKTPSMSIIAAQGTLDQAYPPFILASTGAALGWDVSMFFTFYGLLCIRQSNRVVTF